MKKFIVGLLVGLAMIIAPSLANATPVDAKIGVGWNPVVDANEYTIYWQFVGDTLWTDMDVMGQATNAADFDIKRIQSDQNFMIYMTASNEHGESEPSITHGPILIEGLGIYIGFTPDAAMVDFKPLSGAVLSGDNYIRVYPEEAIKSVTFNLDGEFVKTEGVKPFDMYGAGVGGVVPFNVDTLIARSHEVEAVITLLDDRIMTISSTFSVVGTISSPIITTITITYDDGRIMDYTVVPTPTP